MSNVFTPLFEMQRTMIDQNRKAITESVDAGRSVVDAVNDGLDGQRSLVERNAEFSRSSTHAFIDAVESALPEDAAEFDELRDTVDEGFDAFEESQTEVWDSLMDAIEESNTTYDELADSYLEAVDSSFDAFIENSERFEESFDSAAETIPVEGGDE